MSRLLLVCGPTGVGKTTYSVAMAKKIEAIRFSIDPWMQTLFAADMKELDFSWMIERVNRCNDQIWQVSQQILALDGNVILDLGFTTKEERQLFIDRAKKLEINAEVHYLIAPTELRRQRVNKRNEEKDPDIYAFEVTDMMFEFMEPRFEIPDQAELKYGYEINNI